MDPSKERGRALVLCLVSAAIFSSFVIVQAVTNEITLLRPRWNVPVIRLASESFVIEAETSMPLVDASNLTARVTSPHGNFSLAVSDVTQAWHAIRATATFPGGTLEDVLYDLEITVGGLTAVQRHAVKVVSAYKGNFTVIVWADTQVGFSTEYDEGEDGNAHVWLRTPLHVRAMVDQANLIHPEFVLVCGDLTETALASEYAFMHDELMRLQVPVFAGGGNHDYFQVDEYRRWMRYNNFTFDYGPDYHFTYVDTGMHLDALRDHMFDWLKADLEAHASTPVKIVAAHAPPYVCKGNQASDINRNFEKYQQEVVDLLRQQGVVAYLYGHDHQDKITFGNCTPADATVPHAEPLYIQTNDGREQAAYRVLQFTNRTLVNVTAVVNATTGERSAHESLTAYRLDSRGRTVDLILSIEMNVTANATARIYTITNRFPEQDFANLTLRVDLDAAGATVHSSPGALAYIARILPRPGTGGITAEVNFFLARDGTTSITVTEA